MGETDIVHNLEREGFGEGYEAEVEVVEEGRGCHPQHPAWLVFATIIMNFEL